MSAAANADALVTIFGGSGFLGRHVVRALARRHDRLRVAVRHPHLARRLLRADEPSRIEIVRADVRSPDMVEAAVRGAGTVINLVGILVEQGEQRFDAVQARGAGTVARAAARAGARLVHVSAIGADPHARARYAMSKARGETLVLAAAPAATILRPSIIFGPGDEFLNRFAAMARVSPVLPLIGGGLTRFQPVFVEDVAHAVAKAVAGDTRPGTIYELGGPDVRTFRQLLEFVLATSGLRRVLVPIPFAIAGLQASVLQFLPTSPLTPDQVALLEHDNVVSAAAGQEGRTLEGLGIAPASMEAVVPTYLRRFAD
jgi:uncharacterized protein YbjT (DUF2867 family)